MTEVGNSKVISDFERELVDTVREKKGYFRIRDHQ